MHCFYYSTYFLLFSLTCCIISLCFIYIYIYIYIYIKLINFLYIYIIIIIIINIISATLSYQNCVITPGCRLMRTGYCTCFHTLYEEKYIYIYIKLINFWYMYILLLSTLAFSWTGIINLIMNQIIHLKS